MHIGTCHGQACTEQSCALCQRAEGFFPKEWAVAPLGVDQKTNLCMDRKIQACYGLIALAQKRLPPADLEAVFWEMVESTERSDFQGM